MKIYTFLARAQEDIYKNYFLSSLPDECEPCSIIHEDEYVDYGVNSLFSNRMKSKASFMLNQCKKNFGDIIIFSDADVQFFGPVKETLLQELEDFDIACLQGGFGHCFALCSGFFICRCNDSSLNLFENMLEFFYRDDQYSLNQQRWLCKHKCLTPGRFFTIGQTLHKLWEETSEFNIPKDILVHHASGTIGISNKKKLMDIVRKKYER